jgi:DNA-binding transcriptional LysR family regulator
VLIAPLDHPWAITGNANLNDLQNERVIFREEDSGTYNVVKQGLENAGMRIEDLQPALTLSNAEAIALAVQEGLGIGFVSEVVVSRLVAEKVATIHINRLSENLRQDIYIGRNMLQPSTIAQKAFWDFVTSPTNQIGKTISLEILYSDAQSVD